MNPLWTTTPPTAAGWYWVTFAGSAPLPAYVDKDRVVEFAIHRFRIGENLLFQREIAWSVQPIVPPETSP